jgi:chaperonin GroES
MKIQPLDDRVLVQPIEAEDTTASGIIIPDTAKEKPIIGLVIEVGTDEDLQELIKAGDKVIYGKYGGEDINIGTEEYKMIQRSDILGIVKE